MIRIAAGVAQSYLIKKVDPVPTAYPDASEDPDSPQASKISNAQTIVLLHVIINETGDVVSVARISGYVELERSAINAVKQWKYRPYLLNGQPVSVDTTVTVTFSR